MLCPRLEIDLGKIDHNASHLVDLFGKKGITVMGVTKCMLGEPRVAKILCDAGVPFIGDSRIENIRRLRRGTLKTVFVLLRSPMLSQVDEVVEFADISVNTEKSVLQALSAAACSMHKTHQVMLMVELGDLREGVPADELHDMVAEVIRLPGLELVGLGTNLGCIGGVSPNAGKMSRLSRLTQEIEERFGLELKIVSGGNSANHDWFVRSKNVGRINNLRIGEMLFLGRETLSYRPVHGLFTDAVTLVAEVIECKRKDSVPNGTIHSDAFGQIPQFKDRGRIRRAILGLGRQDVRVEGLTPCMKTEILGSSSDHVVISAEETGVKVGDEVRFLLDYGALLTAMTSPFVAKVFLPAVQGQR